MAYNAAGLNVQDRNPYNIVITNGVTAPGALDVYVVFNAATVTSREDFLIALEQLKLLLETASGTAFGPP